jgi:c-di-GMP-binding flagellar brake protein YcgR
MRFGNRKDKAVNRRRDRRDVLPTLAAYTDEGSDYREKLVNVSRNGCCLQTPVAIKAGEHLLIHFIASANFYVIDDSFCIDGVVVWRHDNGEGGYRYGLEFSDARTEFFASETRAFQDHVARLACESYLDSNTTNNG